MPGPQGRKECDPTAKEGNQEQHDTPPELPQTNASGGGWFRRLAQVQQSTISKAVASLIVAAFLTRKVVIGAHMGACQNPALSVFDARRSRRCSSSNQLSWRGKNPGTGWGVDILWPDGETEAIKGFITELDADQWIAEHSKAEQGNTNRKSAQML